MAPTFFFFLNSIALYPQCFNLNIKTRVIGAMRLSAFGCFFHYIRNVQKRQTRQRRRTSPAPFPACEMTTACDSKECGSSLNVHVSSSLMLDFSKWFPFLRSTFLLWFLQTERDWQLYQKTRFDLSEKYTLESWEGWQNSRDYLKLKGRYSRHQLIDDPKAE